MAETRFQCPYCGRVGSTSREVAPGAAARCPGCRGTFKIEGTGPDQPATPAARAQPLGPTLPAPVPSASAPALESPDVAPARRRRMLLAVALGSAVMLASVGVGATWLAIRPRRPADETHREVLTTEQVAAHGANDIVHRVPGFRSVRTGRRRSLAQSWRLPRTRVFSLQPL